METVAYTSDSGATFALTVSPAIKALMPGASNTGINSKTPQMTIRGEKPNPRGYRGRKIGGSSDAPDSVFVPVTTQAACAAGKEIWGYPKFVTPIGFSLEAKRFKGTVSDPEAGDTMVELSGDLGIGLPAPQLDLVLYSHHNGSLLRTLINTRGGGRSCLPGSLRLKLSNSTHPMAQRLAQLGLANAAPKMVFHSHGLQLRLNAGADITHARGIHT